MAKTNYNIGTLSNDLTSDWKEYGYIEEEESLIKEDSVVKRCFVQKAGFRGKKRRTRINLIRTFGKAKLEEAEYVIIRGIYFRIRKDKRIETTILGLKPTSETGKKINVTLIVRDIIPIHNISYELYLVGVYGSRSIGLKGIKNIRLGESKPRLAPKDFISELIMNVRDKMFFLEEGTDAPSGEIIDAFEKHPLWSTEYIGRKSGSAYEHIFQGKTKSETPPKSDWIWKLKKFNKR